MRVFTEIKYIFFRLGDRQWANCDWGELEVLPKVLK